MRIVQLTDLHVPPLGVNTKFGMDTRRNFLDMLPRVAALQPDRLIISGDLCYESGDMPTYTWLKECIETLGIPYSVIAGNHDDSALLAQVFGLTLRQKEVYFSLSENNQHLIFLDSAVGSVSDTQLEWLQTQLHESSGPALLSMHHPPLLIGVPYIDTHWPFNRSADLMAVLMQHPAPVYVFCGHYHVERLVHDQNVHVHVTPSLYFQVDANRIDFAVEHTRIALRVIDVEDERLFTAVHYFDGFPTNQSAA